MAKFKKENWRGQEAFEKIVTFSAFAIAVSTTFLMRLVADNFQAGIYVFFGIGIYFMVLAYMSKSFAHRVTLNYAGIRRWRCRYDLGRGRTGNITFFIEDKFIIPLEDAPISFQKKAAKTEKIIGDVEMTVTSIERGDLKVNVLSVLEESKIKKEQALKELRDQEIINIIEEEYILDTLLKPYYEKETGQEAFIKGKRTKEFTEWKKSDGKVVKFIQKEIRAQIVALEKNKKQTQKDKQERRLQLIGEELALGYPLNEIIAADMGESEGGAVHGFLKTHYEDYGELIGKHQILDIAQDIAKEIWIPKIVKVVQKIHLAGCVKTVAPLYEEASFDHEQNLPFKKILVYAQEPLSDAVDWKERVPKTIHYYPNIPVTNGYSNIIIPTRITHDTPMVFVAHSAGKDYFVKNLKLDPKEVKTEEIKNMKEKIADLKINIDELKEKATDFEKEARSQRERKVEYKDAYEMATKVYMKKNLKQYDPRDPLEKVNIGKTLLYIIAIIGIIFIIIILINLGATTSPNLTNSTSLLNIISNYLQYSKFLGCV